MKCVSIEFDVALYLKVLSCFEERPRWSGETHASDVEIRKPRAALIKDVVDPGQTDFCLTADRAASRADRRGRKAVRRI